MRRSIAVAACLAALLVVAVACEWAGAQVTADTVTWERPTTRTDGSALAASEILQFRIDWSAVPGGPYSAGSATVPGTALSFTRSNRPSGRACYVAVTIDTAGLISANSNEACTEKCPLGQRVNAAGACVLLALPSRPTNLNAT